MALPNGAGLVNGPISGDGEEVGAAPNALTLAAKRATCAGTPWHQYVAARPEAV